LAKSAWRSLLAQWCGSTLPFLFPRSYVWVDTRMERNGKWQCIAEGVMESRKKK
jgi:hypothetical protein